MATKHLQHLQHVCACVARCIAWILGRPTVLHGPGGHPFIVAARAGRVMPVMAGGVDGDGDAGSGEEDGDGSDGDGNGNGAGSSGDGDGDGSDGDGDGAGSGGDGKTEPEWKVSSRKHERRARAEKKRADELQAKLDERDAENQSEQEKAIAQARKEARDEALTESQKERRSDRLEVAVTRLAARGIKVGEGDDEKTLKFADPEDALVFLERAIVKGDIDADDVFDDDHKVKTEFVEDELADLLARKPRLAAGDEKPNGKPAGDADAGKGAKAKNAGNLSVEEHLERKKRNKT